MALGLTCDLALGPYHSLFSVVEFRPGPNIRRLREKAGIEILVRDRGHRVAGAHFVTILHPSFCLQESKTHGRSLPLDDEFVITQTELDARIKRFRLTRGALVCVWRVDIPAVVLLLGSADRTGTLGEIEFLRRDDVAGGIAEH